MIGQKIGDYEVIKSLGRGGFGSVWKATSADGSIVVAIKVLNPQALDNEKVVKKFFHEAMILAKLDHPNITKLMEFFPDGNNYAIVMEYVEGIELKQYLQQQNGLMPFDQAFKIAKQTLDAFQYANEHGILHRDIKPGNIMLDQNGDSKIMDFGIAKISTTATHDTAAKMLSVHYTPPERFDPSKSIDARSDIYSLGLVFYEMFAGRRPFMVEETSQIMFCHLNEIPDPPQKYAESLNPRISNAILKALEKNPDDRFNDFREFSKALDLDAPAFDDVTLTGDEDVTQMDQPIVVTTKKTRPIEGEPAVAEAPDKKRKSRLLIAAVSAIVLALLLGGGFMAIKGYLPGVKQPSTVADSGPGKRNIKGFNEITHAKDGSILISIPDGEFIMGSDLYSAEKPVQKIFLSQYYIDKYLVTNKQFEKFVDATKYVTDAEKDGSGMVRIGRRWKKVEGANWRKPDGLTPIEGKENYPVTQVSYNDALSYCKWAGKDLPTEAQWEKAARGPNGTKYPWGDSDPDDTMANFDNIIGNTAPVDTYEKGQSHYGVFDMAGNVYQWCKDWYGTGERKDKNPSGPESGKERVIKGGSFIEGVESLRSANRDRYEPSYSSFLFGFRCAKCEEK